ncbi:unnamed protein product [Sphagnum balticum]
MQLRDDPTIRRCISFAEREGRYPQLEPSHSQNPVRVTHDFYEKTYIGDAYVQVEGNEVVAYLNLHDKELFTKEMVESLYAVVGGSVINREGGQVKEWVLKQIALTPSPADKTLPKLKWNKKDNCCEYSGPPFRPCRFCGNRETV